MASPLTAFTKHKSFHLPTLYPLLAVTPIASPYQTRPLFRTILRPTLFSYAYPLPPLPLIL